MWLGEFIRRYPTLVKVVLGDDGEYEIHMCRPLLMMEIQQDRLDVKFESFERSLRYAGLYCAQSTHGNRVWKVWKLRKK